MRSTHRLKAPARQVEAIDVIDDQAFRAGGLAHRASFARMPLAYVFWHWPAAGVDRDAYEQRVSAFHQALELPGSRTFRLARAPYAGQPAAPYEDWYPVEGWAQLGTLNERAVSGARRDPHDATAALAGQGAGAIYARVQANSVDGRFAAWLSKPVGITYDDFVTELCAATPQAAIWQRQMVLGPAPEFGVFASEPLSLPWPASTTDPRPLQPSK